MVIEENYGKNHTKVNGLTENEYSNKGVHVMVNHVKVNVYITTQIE